MSSSGTQLPDPLQQQQQQPPPTAVVAQQASPAAHYGHGSVGPVIGVLAVITILGAIAVMIGRLCSRRRIMGRGRYDFEEWAETKCASCIDGRILPPPPPPGAVEAEHSVSSSSGDAAAPAVEETQRTEEDRSTPGTAQ